MSKADLPALDAGEKVIASAPASRGWRRSGLLVVTDARVAFASRGSIALEFPLTAIARVHVDGSALTIAPIAGKETTFRLGADARPDAIMLCIDRQVDALRDLRDRLAKALTRVQLARAPDPDRIEPGASWEQQLLPAQVIEATGRAADGIAVALNRLGYTLESTRPGDRDDQAVEVLAEAQHEAWLREMRAEGWQGAPFKDPARKVHPALVPWAQLDESDRAKGRAAAEEVAAALARTGLALLPAQSTGEFVSPFRPDPEEEEAPGASPTLETNVPTDVSPARRVEDAFEPEPSHPATDAIGPHAPGDTVEASVFAPPEVEAGDTAFVQVFAHMIEQAEKAQAMAAEFDAEAERRAVRTLGLPVPPGARLDFELVVPGTEVDEPVQSLTWNGRPESVQFAVAAPAAPRTLVGTLHAALEGVPVGHLKFKLAVVAERTARPPPGPMPAGEAARRYTKAFVSYASGDRSGVLRRVQMLSAVGIEYFQDVLDLEPGQRWERELYRHIDECDLFLLCWSERAKDSEWVRREAARALERKADDDAAPPEIRPVILEGPPVPEPWPELAHLHFNDRLAYLLAVEGG